MKKKIIIVSVIAITLCIIGLIFLLGNQCSYNVDSNYRGQAFDKFYNIIITDNYRMIGRHINEDGTEENFEVYRENDMMVHVNNIGRTITRDGKIYDFYNGLDGFYFLSNQPDSFFRNPESEIYGIAFAGRGMTEFDGRILQYEKYTFTYGDIRHFFFDGDVLVGMRIYSARFDDTTDTIIYILDNNVPYDVFDIPAGYQEFDDDEHAHLIDWEEIFGDLWNE